MLDFIKSIFSIPRVFQTELYCVNCRSLFWKSFYRGTTLGRIGQEVLATDPDGKKIWNVVCTYCGSKNVR